MREYDVMPVQPGSNCIYVRNCCFYKYGIYCNECNFYYDMDDVVVEEKEIEY